MGQVLTTFFSPTAVFDLPVPHLEPGTAASWNEFRSRDDVICLLVDETPVMLATRGELPIFEREHSSDR